MGSELFWGKELILDVGGCDQEKIKDVKYLEQWVKGLVQEIDMVPFGEPEIVEFGEGHLYGITVKQWIMTSNILVHFCSNTGEAYFNIFSCKDFDPQVVVTNIEKAFSPKTLTARLLERKAQ